MRMNNYYVAFSVICALSVAHALPDESKNATVTDVHMNKLLVLQLDNNLSSLVSAMEKAMRILQDSDYLPSLDVLPEPLSLNCFIKIKYSEMEIPVTKDQGRRLVLGNRESPSIATWVATHGDRAARAELKAARGALAIERHWVPARYHVVEEYAARRMYISAVSEAAQAMEVLSPADPGVRHVLSLLLEHEEEYISEEEDIVDVLAVLISVLGGKEWPTPQRLAHFHAAGLYQAGLLDEALSIYEHLHQEIDILPSSYVALSRIYEQFGRADEAITLLISGHEIYPRDSLILTELAMYDMRTRAYKRARERIDSVLSRSPEFPYALLLSARLHIHERELVTAMHEIIDALVFFQGWQVDADRLLVPVFADLYTALSNED